MAAGVASVRSLRQDFLLNLPTFGAGLTRFEFSFRCFCPHSTSVRDFVAEQLHEQGRGGVENFPVQARLLRDLFTGFVDGAFGTAGHVFDSQIFHRHQGVFAGELASFLVQKVQALSGLIRSCFGQASYGLFAAMRSALLTADRLLQDGNFVLAVLIPTRIIECQDLAGFMHAREQVLRSPIQGQRAMAGALAFDLRNLHGQ